MTRWQFSSVTFGDQQTKTLEQCGEDAADPRFYTVAEAKDALNQAQRVLAFLTLCVERNGVLPLTATTPTYSLLATVPDWLVPLRLSVSGITRLQPRALSELAAENATWRNSPGTPDAYAIVGCDRLCLNHQPVALATVLTLQYAAIPDDMTSELQVSPVPVDYHDTMVDWAVARLRATKEGGGEGGPKIGEYFGRFANGAEQLSLYVQKRSRAFQYDTIPPPLQKAALKTLMEGWVHSGSNRKPK